MGNRIARFASGGDGSSSQEAVMIYMVTLGSLSTNLSLTLLIDIANEGVYVGWSVPLPHFPLISSFCFLHMPSLI